MISDKEMTNDPTKIANGFHFSNVAEKLPGNIRSLGIDFTDYLKNPSEIIFHFESADSQEILLIIDSFETNKATGLTIVFCKISNLGAWPSLSLHANAQMKSYNYCMYTYFYLLSFLCLCYVVLLWYMLNGYVNISMLHHWF